MNITNQFEDYRIGWEFLKYKVRQFSQVYSKRKACERREKRVNLEKRLKSWKVISQKTLLQKKSLGAILRSKVRWYEDGEKSTKCFLNLEKSNRNKTSIKN